METMEYQSWRVVEQEEALPFGRGYQQVEAKKVQYFPIEDKVTGVVDFGRLNPMLLQVVLENARGYQITLRMQVLPRGRVYTLKHPDTLEYPGIWAGAGRHKVYKLDTDATPVVKEGLKEKYSEREILGRLAPMLGRPLAQRVLEILDTREQEVLAARARTAAQKAKKRSKKSK